MMHRPILIFFAAVINITLTFAAACNIAYVWFARFAHLIPRLRVYVTYWRVMRTATFSAVSRPPITHHAALLLARVANFKFSLGANKVLAHPPLKPQLTELKTSCYQSVCTSVPDEIKTVESVCSGFAGPAGAGATTTAISPTEASTVLSASTNQKQSSPTVPAVASTVAQSSTTASPKTTARTSSSAATNSVAGQASTASASTAGAGSSGKQRIVSVGELLALFMGIVYNI